MNKPRMVVCAANRVHIALLNGMVGEEIVLGARHYDSLMREQINNSLWDWKCCEVEQGFIDQFGVFMTREEAHEVAKAADQIKYRCGGDDGCLYSENLY